MEKWAKNQLSLVLQELPFSDRSLCSRHSYFFGLREVLLAYAR